MLDFNNHYEKLEKLEWEIDQDVPIPDGIKHTRMPFEQWKKVCIDFYENSYGVDIVAVKNGKYIGSTCLSIYPKSDPNKAWTESLGVIRNYRRRGLATALKFLSIEGLYKSMGCEKRNISYPQFTDHCFTGDYPKDLKDNKDEKIQEQLSLLSDDDINI